MVHVHSCYYPIIAILESLSNDDGDGNENGKKAIGLDNRSLD